jgi:hypothetical protein
MNTHLAIKVDQTLWEIKYAIDKFIDSFGENAVVDFITIERADGFNSFGIWEADNDHNVSVRRVTA